MKILFFHRWVGVHCGGTETHIKELAYRLAERGHNVEILTREGEVLKKFHPKIVVHYISKNWRESPYSYTSMNDPRIYWYTTLFVIKSFIKFLNLWLKDNRYDIISVHFFTEAIVARLIRLTFKTPYTFVLEGYTELEGKEAKHANLQIASSQHEVDECYKNYGYKPILKPHGIDLKIFNMNVDGSQIRRKYDNGRNKLVLTVSRLEPRKGSITLIETAEIVCKIDQYIKFIIIGEGILEKELYKLVEEKNLSKNVIFTGKVSSEDLPKYYKACDIFVLPSLYEGFGIVFLEAMACGLPVISTTVGGVSEAVGDCGILIPPKNPKLLAEKILELLKNDTMRQKFISKGLEKTKQYDHKKSIDIFEKACMDVIKSLNNN